MSNSDPMRWKQRLQQFSAEQRLSEAALDALEKRNLLTHTYEEASMLEALKLIESQFYPILNRLLKALEQRANES